MAYEYILYETDGPIARIILNRPEKMNALCYPLRQEVKTALRVAERDDNVRVVIIKGAGRTFSAGYDLTPADPSPNRPVDGYVSASVDRVSAQYARDLINTWWTMWDLLKPVIAQIHGYCLAGGSEMSSMCDMRIVAEDAQIGFPPARAISLGDVMYQPWLMGLTRAKYFLFTGDSINGKEAVEWGWATKAYPREKLEEETEKLARRIALIPTDLVMFNKRAINRTFEIMGMRAAIDTAADMMVLSGYRESAGEFARISRERGLKAALEWRDAPFRDYRTVEEKEKPR